MGEGEWSFSPPGNEGKKCKLCGAPLSLHKTGSEVFKKCIALFGSKFKGGLAAMLMGTIMKKKGGFKMGEFQKSLNPASATKYLPARVRATDTGTLKFQGEGNMELSVSVDPKITEWVGKLPHTLESYAGTGVKYAACQLVPHDKADPKVADFAGPVRIQMKGAALNRDWGAEFVVDNAKLRNWSKQYLEYLTTEETKKANSAQGKLVDEQEPEESKPDDESPF